MSGLISPGTPTLFRKNPKRLSGNFSTQQCSSIVSSRKAVICSRGFVAATSIKSGSMRGFDATPLTREQEAQLVASKSRDAGRRRKARRRQKILSQFTSPRLGISALKNQATDGVACPDAVYRW